MEMEDEGLTRVVGLFTQLAQDNVFTGEQKRHLRSAEAIETFNAIGQCTTSITEKSKEQRGETRFNFLCFSRLRCRDEVDSVLECFEAHRNGQRTDACVAEQGKLKLY
eukprot:GHVS01009349.1.p1 GENE.GHVS01009349.1~~GHVS01009349.1.p1  ORF type:complete len:108 (-),score=17.07 GHVS01009349.1:138-461(-)